MGGMVQNMIGQQLIKNYTQRSVYGALRMNREIKICDECESKYYADTSQMMKLCPDCSHHLYGYPNCSHIFENGRCIKCHWNRKRSEYINGLKNDKTDEWMPITLSELQELIDSGVSKMTSEQINMWNEISVVPEKWQEVSYGQEGGGFWVVAICEDEVIWYNDIEEGFNISKFAVIGKIDDYGAEQDELQWTMNKLK